MELNLKPALSMTHVVFVRISHASTTWLQDDRDSKFGPHLIRQSVDSRLSAEELSVRFICLEIWILHPQPQDWH